jgi:hypothetical protein
MGTAALWHSVFDKIVYPNFHGTVYPKTDFQDVAVIKISKMGGTMGLAL